jgi:hypothetical protein
MRLQNTVVTNDAGLELLRDHAGHHGSQRPQDRAPTPRRQPPVREQHDQDEQQDHGQPDRGAGQDAGDLGRGDRALGRGQAVQGVLFGRHGDGQGQAGQAEQPADRVAWDTAGDQAACARVGEGADGQQAVEADLVGVEPAGAEPAGVQPEQHQRRGEHGHDRARQPPGR